MKEETTAVCAQRNSKRAKQNKRCRRAAYVLVACFFACILCVIWNSKSDVCATATEQETTEAEATEQTDTGVETRVIKENDQFDVQLTYGIDGYANYSTPIPIMVTITSTQDFTGSVGVRAATIVDDMDVTSSVSYYNGSEYAQDVSLAAGTENTVTLIMYASDSSTAELYIRDEDGDVVYEERDILDMETSDDLTIGILSDDYSGMTYFDGEKFSLGTYQELTRTLSLHAGNLPDDAELLGIIDILIVDNYDTANLSDRQYQAICTWVKNGGVLLLGLGANYQNVLHVFQDDFISGTFGDLSKHAITLSTGGSVTYDAETGLMIQTETDVDTTEASAEEDVVCIENVDTLSFELTDGTAKEDAAGQTDIWYKDVGNGRVAVLSYALSMEPITGDADKATFAMALLSTILADFDPDTLFSGSSGVDTYVDMSELIPQADRQKTSTYLLIFAIYIVLAGPLTYLILKKMKKRRYLWIAVPAWALLFTGVIFLVGRKSTIHKPIAGVVSVKEIRGETLSENIMTQIICPQAKEYTVTVDDSCYSVREDTSYSYSTGTSTVKKTGDGTKLILHEGDVFRNLYYQMKRTSENAVGHIETAIDLYTDGLSGTVTNNTTEDFSYVFVATDFYIYLIDDLKSGETYTLQKEDLYTTNGEGIYYGSTLYWDLVGENEEDEDAKKLFAIGSYVYDKIHFTNGSGEGYVWGITEGTASNIIDASDASVYENTAYLESFTVKSKYTDIEGEYVTDISSCAVATNGSYDISDKYLYDGEATIAYQFQTKPTQLVNRSYEERVTNGGYSSKEFYDSYTKVEAYNVNTGEYDEIFTDSDTLSDEELEDYVMENSIMLRYSGGYLQMPTISAYREE